MEAALPPPAPIHAINIEKWADASWSPVRPIELPFGKCIRDAGGCPFKPVELPRCPEGQRFVEIQCKEQLESLVGTKVVLRGALRFMQTSDLTFYTYCQRKYPPELDLRVGKINPRYGDAFYAEVVLDDPRFPEAFGCPGDDETRCCGLPTKVVVLAHGKLTRGEDPHYDPFHLEMPHLCTEGRKGQ